MRTQRWRTTLATALLLLAVATIGTGCDDDAPSADPPPSATLPLFGPCAGDVDARFTLICARRTHAHQWSALTDQQRESLLEALRDTPSELTEASSAEDYASCRASEKTGLCVARLRPSALCSPVPVSGVDLLKIAAPNVAVRDAITVADPEADDPGTSLLVDHLCDVLERSEEQTVREADQDRLGLDESTVDEFGDDLDQRVARLNDRLEAGEDLTPLQKAVLRQHLAGYRTSSDPAVRSMLTHVCRGPLHLRFFC